MNKNNYDPYPDQTPDNPYSYVNSYALTQKYLKEVKGEDLTIEEIKSRPLWKQVWFWWKALEKYAGKPMPEISLEECKRIYED